jgi:hypothetical protein
MRLYRRYLLQLTAKSVSSGPNVMGLLAARQGEMAEAGGSSPVRTSMIGRVFQQRGAPLTSRFARSSFSKKTD